jgi:hypothetical protein
LGLSASPGGCVDALLVFPAILIAAVHVSIRDTARTRISKRPILVGF